MKGHCSEKKVLETASKQPDFMKEVDRHSAFIEGWLMEFKDQ